MLLRGASSELPVIVVPTISPFIPLPLEKGKGEEFFKEGLRPSLTPILHLCFYMGKGGRILKRGKKSLFNTLCPHLKRKESFFLRGETAPLVLPLLLLQIREGASPPL
jgi:hypothetical protein